MNNRKKLLWFALIMLAAFAVHGQVGEFFPVTIVTQEDADNVDLRLFADNPDFTPGENERIKRAVLDIALYFFGFDIGYDIWTLVDEEAATSSLFSYLERPLQDSAFWITTNFMTSARREGGRLYLWAQIRIWPRDNPNLDAGSWMELIFANVNGEYKLIHLLFG